MFARAATRAVAGLRASVAPGVRRFSSNTATSTPPPPPPTAEVPAPEFREMRRLFVHAAVPFVAFGFVDNSVLIHAGDMIDNTFGLYFGLPTLAAAAMGQVFSDTSGVLFGSTIEAISTKLGLPIPKISPEQHLLRATKLVKTAGSVIGVVTGCCLGMLNLLIIDVGAKERAEKEAKLSTLFETVIEGGSTMLECDGASLFILDYETRELWTKTSSNDTSVRLPWDKGIVGTVTQTGKPLNIPDAYKHEGFSRKSDEENNYKTVSILTHPVTHSKSGEVLAVVQMVNKQKGSKIVPFTKEDEKLIKMLCTHVAVFIETVDD
mmetsp:Transcript_36330/g.43944  ORF Transcript_36330/g.43944 Transcript_36330/m.43944 type:complete len:321 (-) Transcript_36330:120-1082(-)|eukprot:CAMPEP_0197852834 /NCGR_PEP_ID=MMETSP1438-20131217/21511_1 /TAXON_ID=1461541 /ORGANISM="Pterosperma sp., Strain CCMP1384" /LENGTH=320 /DNA_ID=CAMNT_0043467033 /DNA_START=216 /DNA_END=1178 /DNA_ORIENTATION=+